MNPKKMGGNKSSLRPMKMETLQKLRGEAKAFLGGKFIPINVYIKRQEIFQINNLTLSLMNQKITEPKVSKENGKQ